MNRSFKKGKILSVVIFIALLIAIIIAVMWSLSDIGNDNISIIPFIIALPILISIILSPFALFYTIKSYETNVENETERTWYSVCLVILNFLVVVLLVAIGFHSF